MTLAKGIAWCAPKILILPEHATRGRRAVFHSPVVHTPQRGRKLAAPYLGAAFQVFFNPTFRYVREIVGPSDAMLEFETEIDGVLGQRSRPHQVERRPGNHRIQGHAQAAEGDQCRSSTNGRNAPIQSVTAVTPNNAFERTEGIVGRVWPRHGHCGRPLNSVVRRHVSRGTGRLVNACEIAGPVLSPTQDERSKAFPLLPGEHAKAITGRCLCGAFLGKLGAPGCHARVLVRGLPIYRCRQRNGQRLLPYGGVHGDRPDRRLSKCRGQWQAKCTGDSARRAGRRSSARLSARPHLIFVRVGTFDDRISSILR